MRFTCNRCGKLFSTASEPVPGRVYRVPCRCGNTIVLYGETPGKAPSPLAPRKRTVPPPLPAGSAAAPPAEPPRPRADPFARTIYAGATMPAGETPTAIVNASAAARMSAARQGAGADARERSEISLSTTEPLPGGVRRALDVVVDGAETLALLHVTPRRAGVAAAAAVVLGLATWIYVAMSGSTATTTDVIALRAPEPRAERDLAPEREHSAGARSPPARSDATAQAEASRRERDVPLWVPVPTESEGSSSGAALEPEPERPARGDRSTNAAPDAVAADPIVMTFSGEPTVHRAAGASGPDGAATDEPSSNRPAKATRSANSAGRALTAREAMAALGERQSALEECIDQASRGDDRGWLGRRVRLVVTFEPSGRASAADLEDDEIAPTPLGACIRAVARGISVPEFEGAPVSVVVPLRLGTAK